MADARSRNWTFIVYPESAPELWMDILDNEMIQFAVSPLHDLDVNPDGEVKKAHYHVVVAFDGNKSYTQICELSSLVNGTNPQVVKNMRAMLRYFLHLDNPEKTQYSGLDINLFGGFDLQTYLSPTKGEIIFYIAEMQDYVVANDITEMCDLGEYARSNKFDTWYPILISHTLYLEKFIRSKRHKPNLPDLPEE